MVQCVHILEMEAELQVSVNLNMYIVQHPPNKNYTDVEYSRVATSVFCLSFETNIDRKGNPPFYCIRVKYYGAEIA